MPSHAGRVPGKISRQGEELPSCWCLILLFTYHPRSPLDNQQPPFRYIQRFQSTCPAKSRSTNCKIFGTKATLPRSMEHRRIHPLSNSPLPTPDHNGPLARKQHITPPSQQAGPQKPSTQLKHDSSAQPKRSANQGLFPSLPKCSAMDGRNLISLVAQCL